MNKGIVRIIMVLAAMAAVSGCSSNAAQQPILSATQVNTEIRVSVRTLEPVVVAEALVAARN